MPTPPFHPVMHALIPKQQLSTNIYCGESGTASGDVERL